MTPGLFKKIERFLLEKGFEAEEAQQMSMEVKLMALAICLEAAIKKMPEDKQKRYMELDEPARIQFITDENVFEILNEEEADACIKQAIDEYHEKVLK